MQFLCPQTLKNQVKRDDNLLIPRSKRDYETLALATWATPPFLENESRRDGLAKSRWLQRRWCRCVDLS